MKRLSFHPSFWKFWFLGVRGSFSHKTIYSPDAFWIILAWPLTWACHISWKYLPLLMWIPGADGGAFITFVKLMYPFPCVSSWSTFNGTLRRALPGCSLCIQAKRLFIWLAGPINTLYLIGWTYQHPVIWLAVLISTFFCSQRPLMFCINRRNRLQNKKKR